IRYYIITRIKHIIYRHVSFRQLLLDEILIKSQFGRAIPANGVVKKRSTGRFKWTTCRSVKHPEGMIGVFFNSKIGSVWLQRCLKHFRIHEVLMTKVTGGDSDEIN